MARIVRVALALSPALPLATSLFGTAGCEALVSSQVPAFICSDSDPASCPAGKVCATATGECVPASTSCLTNPCAAGLVCDMGTLKCVPPTSLDAGQPDATMPADAATKDGSTTDGSMPGTDAGGPPYGVGHACTKPSDCSSALCADSSILGTTYFNKVGAVCTIPCCDSESCGEGNVCIGPGTGGHYCVPSASLGRPEGTKPGGATCNTAADCRSGVCFADSTVGATQKVCADSCCLDTNCTGGATCRPLDVDTTGHHAYGCSYAPAAPTTGMTCSTAYSCQSGVCNAVPECTPPCCGMDPGGTYDCLAVAITSGPEINTTFNFQIPTGSGTHPIGAVGCSSNTYCTSGYCDKADGASMGTCSDMCCVDTDCPRPMLCRPRTGTTHFLRCVSP